MRAKRSITLCPHCAGNSQVENTEKQDSHHVKRLRRCVECLATWSTAEVPLADVKRLKALDRLLKEVDRAKS